MRRRKFDMKAMIVSALLGVAAMVGVLVVGRFIPSSFRFKQLILWALWIVLMWLGRFVIIRKNK